jgi:hypothetical protein
MAALLKRGDPQLPGVVPILDPRRGFHPSRLMEQDRIAFHGPQDVSQADRFRRNTPRPQSSKIE